LGLLYLFDNGVAPYLNYGTSFQPVVGADFEGDVFKPMRGKQFEVGVRYAPSDDLLWSAALFDTRQTNRLTDDTINGWPYQVQTGEVRSRGFETELKADLS
ncbi:TonB-dependent receptor, partial [Ochrobactrum sp. MR31]|nr:TonB-dependent receptor [Ochrobactrum sp. MR31]